MRMKSVLLVSTFALMSAYALGESRAPAPWALDPPETAVKAPPPELKGLLERAAPSTALASPGAEDAAIDLTALRYFVSKNDLKRAAAEIRLIRIKHPTWSPPEDLFNDSGATVDETPIWALFEKADYEGARAAIAERQEHDANWRPSADLVNKLTLAEAVKSLKEASDAQNWEETIRVASENKMLLTCDYIDAMWRTAEALAHTQDNDRALAAFKYILTNCSKRAERVATLEKAMALFGAGPEIDDLVALGRRGADGRNEFEFVKWDRVRAMLGKASADPTAPAPSDADVKALVTRASAGPNARDDQKLLGWWFYSRHDYTQAEAYFRKANAGAPDSKAAEGLVMTLKAEDKLPEALTLAKQYADLGERNRAAWASLELAQVVSDDKTAIPPQDQTTLIAALVEQKDADGAQALAWRFYRNGEFAQARGLFENSLSWRDNEPAAVGLVATLRRLGDGRGYAAALAKYSGAYTKVAELGRAGAYHPAYHAAPSRKAVKVAQRRTHGKGGGGGGGWDSEADAIVAETKAGLYPEALLRLDARRARGRAEPAGLSIVRGWADYNAGHYGASETAFRAAYTNGLKSDAQKGLAQLGVSSTRLP